MELVSVAAMLLVILAVTTNAQMTATMSESAIPVEISTVPSTAKAETVTQAAVASGTPPTLAVVTSTMPPQACSMEEIEKCTAGLEVQGREIAPEYDDTSLNSVCRTWQTARLCVTNVADACDQPANVSDSQTLEDILATKKAKQSAAEWTNAYQYLCETGKAEYESVVRSCLESNPNLTHSARDCYVVYINKTWWLNSEEPINTYRFCTAGKNLLTCLTATGKDSCGAAVGSWIKGYHRGIWSAHLSDIECSLESSFGEGAIAIVSICGAATLVCIICSVLSFFIKPHKATGKHNDQTKASTSEKKRGKENKAFVNGDMEMHDEGLHRRSNTDASSREITNI